MKDLERDAKPGDMTIVFCILQWFVLLRNCDYQISGRVNRASATELLCVYFMDLPQSFALHSISLQLETMALAK